MRRKEKPQSCFNCISIFSKSATNVTRTSAQHIASDCQTLFDVLLWLSSALEIRVIDLMKKFSFMWGWHTLMSHDPAHPLEWSPMLSIFQNWRVSYKNFMHPICSYQHQISMHQCLFSRKLGLASCLTNIMHFHFQREKESVLNHIHPSARKNIKCPYFFLKIWLAFQNC